MGTPTVSDVLEDATQDVYKDWMSGLRQDGRLSNSSEAVMTSASEKVCMVAADWHDQAHLNNLHPPGICSLRPMNTC